jgi:hypothetical protein
MQADNVTKKKNNVKYPREKSAAGPARPHCAAGLKKKYFGL